MGRSSRQFGQYEIIRRLGVGGMAETFEARRVVGGAEQRVCLKRILPAFGLDPKFNEQFLSEARIASALNHSNVVSVLDFGAVDGSEFLVLELVEGLDLRALLSALEGRRLEPELVAFIALELAYALSYAHHAAVGGKQGVVHRDISPSNVLISVRGEVKLADFGIAKAMTNAQATASGLLKGKIPYMAPEQMRARELDGRADLFSLGVSLYEALAGERPFQGAHDVQIMTRLLAGERKPLSELVPHAPPTLMRAVEGLLAIPRDERTPSAEALIEALADCAPPPSCRRRLADLVRAHAGVRVYAPGQERTELGPLDTELSQRPLVEGTAAGQASPGKAKFKSTVAATPGMVQAARAAAAMGAATGAGVPKSTVPARPQAIASSPPPAMPVPQGTIPASPKAIASTPPPSMVVSKETQRARPGASSSRPAPMPQQPLMKTAPRATPVRPMTQEPLTGPTQTSFPREQPSDEVVLPVQRPRAAAVAAIVGGMLLVAAGVAMGFGGVEGEQRPATAPGSAPAAEPTTTVEAAGASTPMAAAPPGDRAAPADALPTGLEAPRSAPVSRSGGRRPAAHVADHSPGATGPNEQAAVPPQPPAASPESAPREPTAPTDAPPDHQPPADPRAAARTEPAAAAPPSHPEAPADPRAAERPEPVTRHAAPREAGSARVLLRADPWGSVWVDGRYIGRSPAVVVLPVGSHVLGGGVGHIMGTTNIRIGSRPNQQFTVHVDYP